MEFGSYHLSQPLLTQEAPAWLNRKILSLLIVTSWDPNWDGVGQLSPIGTVIVKRSSCAEQLQVVYLLVVTSWDFKRGGVGQLSPIRAVIDKKSSCVAQSQVVVSPRQYFLRSQLGWIWAAIHYWNGYCQKEAPARSSRRLYISLLVLLETPTGLELGSYLSLELLLTQGAPAWINRRLLYLLAITSWDPNRDWVGQFLLSQEARARISRKLLCLLVVTPWDSNRDGVWQLSPIKTVIDTRSSCVAQPQIFISPHRYFLRPQLRWSWAAIPYWSCYCHKKLLHGGVAGCISPGCYFLRLQPGWSWAAITYRSCYWRKNLLCGPIAGFFYLLVNISWDPTGIELGNYCHKKLLCGAVAGCYISSSFFHETPTGVDLCSVINSTISKWANAVTQIVTFTIKSNQIIFLDFVIFRVYLSLMINDNSFLRGDLDLSSSLYVTTTIVKRRPHFQNSSTQICWFISPDIFLAKSQTHPTKYWKKGIS